MFCCTIFPTDISEVKIPHSFHITIFRYSCYLLKEYLFHHFFLMWQSTVSPHHGITSVLFLLYFQPDTLRSAAFFLSDLGTGTYILDRVQYHLLFHKTYLSKKRNSSQCRYFNHMNYPTQFLECEVSHHDLYT